MQKIAKRNMQRANYTRGLSLSLCQHIDFVVLFGPAFEVHAGSTAAHGCSSQVARLHRRCARRAVTAALAAPAVARAALAAPKVR